MRLGDLVEVELELARELGDVPEHVAELLGHRRAALVADRRRRRRGSPSWRARRPRPPRPRGRARGRRATPRADTRRCGARGAGTRRAPRRDRRAPRADRGGVDRRVCGDRGAARSHARRRGGRCRCVWRSSASSSGASSPGSTPERARDQPVGEPHVLGQQRPVQVGADRVRACARPPCRCARRCRGPAARVRAAAGPRPGGCARRGSRSRRARARRRRPPSLERDLDRDVADQARPVLAHGAHVEQPDAGDLLLAERVGVPEQLVAAAHAEHDRAARGGGVQPGALGLDQVLARTGAGRDPGRRRCRRGRGRRRRAARRGRWTRSSKPIPRHAQRRSSTIRLPRSA